MTTDTEKADGLPINAVMISACLTGVLIGVAPLVPESLRFACILGVTGLWIASVVWWVGTTISQLSRTSIGSGTRSVLAVAAFALVVMAIASVQLEVIRLSPAYRGLSYNVDWRFAWTHAQGLSRFGSLDDSLEFVGAPVDYHVGPAWLAAALHRLVGVEPDDVLFALIPLVSLLTLVAALTNLTKRSVGTGTALSAAIITLTVPEITSTVPAHAVAMISAPVSTVFGGGAWFFPSTMLNGIVGLAIGLSALSLLHTPHRVNFSFLVGVAGLAAVASIKPQYFVGLGLLFGVTSIWATFRNKDWIRVAAAGGILFAAFLLLKLSGIGPSIFSGPVFNPEHAVINATEVLAEPFRLPWLLSGLAIVVAGLLHRRKVDTTPMVKVGGLWLSTGIAFVVTMALLVVTEIPISPAAQARLDELGLDRNLSLDFAQSLVPLRVVLTTLALAGLFALTQHFGRVVRIGTVLVLFLVPGGYALYVARTFVTPMTGYEAAQDLGLLRVLESVEPDGHLFISSDLSDPAQGYARGRALLSPLLTAYGGHQFYVSNLKYRNWNDPRAAGRLPSMRISFGSPWSAWHDRWLDNNGVTHVLTNERCAPLWSGDETSLTIVSRSGDWVLHQNDLGHWAAPAVPEPDWKHITPSHGQSERRSRGD